MEHLALRRLLPGQQQLAVDRLVELAGRVVDLGRAEHRVHAERAVLVRRDRHDPLPDLLVLHQVLEQPDERHGGGDLLLAGALLQLVVHPVAGERDRARVHPAHRHATAQLAAAVAEVLELGGALARVVERRRAVELVVLVDVLVGDRQLEPVAERLEGRGVQLLHLVGGVLALQGVDRPALDGVGEDHRRLAGVLRRRVEGGVHLAVVVATARQQLDVAVGQPLDHLAQARVGTEEVLADVGAGLHRVGLELAVGRLVHLVDQGAVDVLGQQAVPLAAPDDLDHVPAGAAEEGLQLLDDLAVAADRPVELLQVAVDDEREVVELLACGEADRAERLGLAHLAVTEERPDVLPAGVLDAAVLQVAVEARLVDRVQGRQAHGDRRELPELRHQPRVGVGRESLPGAVLDLLAEPVELVGAEPLHQVGARVDAGGRVALDEQLVAAAGVVLAAEEVVVADLVEAGGRGVRRDVAADLEALAVGRRHHHRGVPADQAPDLALHLLVAGEPRLALGRDGVDEVGAAQRGHADLLLAGALEEAQHDVAGAVATVGGGEVVEGVEPLLGLLGIDVRELGGQALVDDRTALRRLAG